MAPNLYLQVETLSESILKTHSCIFLMKAKPEDMTNVIVISNLRQVDKKLRAEVRALQLANHCKNEFLLPEFVKFDYFF